jgi:hypothetical protein
MWLGLAIWRAMIKSAWEQCTLSEARQWMLGWKPDESDVTSFVEDLPALQEGARYFFTEQGVMLKWRRNRKQ